MYFALLKMKKSINFRKKISHTECCLKVHSDFSDFIYFSIFLAFVLVLESFFIKNNTFNLVF